MAEKQISIVLKAIDEATSTIKKVGGDLSSFGEKNKETFSKMAVGGTAAFTAIAFGAKKMIDSYAESERRARQLENAIVGVSKGTKEQVAQVQELTSALQKKAGIDADSLNAGVAQLSTFGLQTKSVMALTKSLADLTVNQNGVNASADQYITSANIMAKAINGQFGVLEKMGIRFTEAQQKMILHGTEAEKVANIQAGLAQNLRETTDTISGVDLASAQMNRTMEDMSENIGQALAPAFNALTQALAPLVAGISSRIAQNPELVSKIIMVAGAVSGLVAVVGGFGLILPSIITGVTALGTALMFLATNPVGLVITGIGLLIAGFIAVRNNWDTIILKIQEMGVRFLDLYEKYKVLFMIFTPLIALGVELYQNWDYIMLKATEMRGRLTTVWNGILTSITAIVTKIKTTVSTIWNSMLQGMKDAVTSVFDWIVGKWDAIVGTITSAVNKLKSLWASVSGGDSGGIAGARATGGPVQSGRTYLVGERGPELFTPSTSGNIVPNNQLSGGGMNISINMGGVVVQNEADEQSLANKIAETLQRQVQLYNLGIN